MKIIRLQTENIKRIKAVDITPQENVVVLSGKNENGKTSVLDSIWLAVEYRAGSKNNPNPLRAGTEKGQVTLDLGDYIVTRKFTSENTTLEVKTPDGSKISSPQKLLDGFIGSMSFDAWEFSRKTESEQRDMLADVLYKITDGQLDLVAFDQRHKEAFDKRTEINREQKRLTTLLTTLTPPTDKDPTEIISSEDLIKSIADSTNVLSTKNNLIRRETEVRNKIARLENELTTTKQELDLINSELTSLPDAPDVQFLKDQLRDIESNNNRAREVVEYNKIRKSLQAVNQEISDLNDTMELIDIEKAEALEASPLPVNGLKISAEGIMIVNEDGNSVPFCQASAARRLRISLAIAMAANPKLRVIRISDGSLLDDDSMAIIRDMAEKQDFQIWIEYASRNDQDRIGVYIEDGMVA